MGIFNKTDCIDDIGIIKQVFQCTSKVILLAQARSYIGTGGQSPQMDALPPPKRPTCNFFLRINFRSPVSSDAQM